MHLSFHSCIHTTVSTNANNSVSRYSICCLANSYIWRHISYLFLWVDESIISFKKSVFHFHKQNFLRNEQEWRNFFFCKIKGCNELPAISFLFSAVDIKLASQVISIVYTNFQCLPWCGHRSSMLFESQETRLSSHGIFVRSMGCMFFSVNGFLENINTISKI